MSSVRAGVVVLDRDLQILAWNHHAEDLWGVRGEEATGKHFLNLEIGLPIERLVPAIRSCAETFASTSSSSTSRRRNVCSSGVSVAKPS